VSISPRTVQNLGIRTAEVKQGNINRAFTAIGVVSVDERTIATVQTRVNGYVEKLYVRALYDTVVRGQPLAEIYSPDWLSAEEEYLALKRGNQATIEPLVQAARNRLLLLGISEAQIARIELDGKATRA
jgi:Cu(I)/Ag(I) efflux system membrane fusion protein